MKSGWISLIGLTVACLIVGGLTSGQAYQPLSSLVGDFDGDNEVGLPDFVLFLDVFGATTSSADWDSTFDLDSNGEIGLSDFVMFLDNFGRTASLSIELSGTGQQTSQIFDLKTGLAIFRITHDGTSYFSIWLMDGISGENIELLASEIGAFDGATAVGIREEGEYILNISADGNWTAIIEQPRPASAESTPKTFTGIGQQVSPFIQLDKGLVIFKLSHTGQSVFAVWLMDKDGNKVELLVAEIGNFDGSKAVGIKQAGIHIMDIDADGEWSIMVE